jgi:hypothetical protein
VTGNREGASWQDRPTEGTAHAGCLWVHFDADVFDEDEDARRDLRATRWAGLGAAGGPPKTAGLLSGARGPPDGRDFEPDKDPDDHNARRIDDLFAGLLEQ